MNGRSLLSLLGICLLLPLALAFLNLQTMARSSRADPDDKPKGALPASALADLVHVEVVVKDERFKGGSRIAPPPLALPLRLVFKGGDKAPTLQPAGKIEFQDPGQAAFFHGSPESAWDEAAKKFKVTLVPRVFEIAVNGPAPPRHADPQAPKLDKVEMEIGGQRWQPAPEAAYKWSVDERHQGKLVLLPAACGAEKPTGRLRLTVAGCDRTIVDLNISVTPINVILDALPQGFGLPKELARRYPELSHEGKFVRVRTYLDSKNLWTAPVADLPGKDYRYYVVPGFIPHFARGTSGQVQLYDFGRDDWLEHRYWPPSSPKAGRLQVHLATKLPTGFKANLALPEGDLAVLIGDKDLVRKPVQQRDGFSFVDFDLPELYAQAVRHAKDRNLPPEIGFEELETKATLRFLARSPARQGFFTMPEHCLGEGSPHSNFGLQTAVEERDVERRESAELRLSLVAAKVVVELKLPESAIPDAWKKVRFEAQRGKDWAVLPEGTFAWEDEGKKVAFLPALLDANGFSAHVRAQIDPFDPAEIALDSGKPLLFDFLPSGLIVRLPAKLKESQNPQLRVTPPREVKTFTRDLDRNKPQQNVRREQLGTNFEGAHVELRIPGYRPLVTPKLTGRDLDARDLEPTAGKKFLIVINNWTQIITANDNVQANINEMQKQICRSLAEQASKEGIQVAGFALVDAKEAKWPPDESAPAFLNTGREAPLVTKGRHPAGPPEEVWKQLRVLLMHPEVAGQHDAIRVVFVTPFQRLSRDLPEGEEKKWLLERIEKCGLSIHTLVLGGPDSTATGLDKLFPQPRLLKIGQTGIDYGGNKYEEVEKLPTWLKDQVLKKAFPE